MAPARARGVVRGRDRVGAADTNPRTTIYTFLGAIRDAAEYECGKLLSTASLDTVTVCLCLHYEMCMVINSFHIAGLGLGGRGTIGGCCLVGPLAAAGLFG